nr:SDR family oxidoreductase [Schlegelella koreensis]
MADFDAIRVGDHRELTRTIGEDEIRQFVRMTGDDNPLHVDPAFAAQTPFKDIVVHGMLGASFISTVIGTQLPGPGALWVSQNMEFLLPVRLGDVLTVACTVTAKHERDRLLDLDTRITNQNQQTVLKGSGRVKLLEAAQPRAATAERTLSRVALVTGGAGGIGEAICRRLAGAGFAVALNYHRNAARAEQIVESIRAASGRAVGLSADVSNEAGAAALIERASSALGPIGVLVNNASPRINPKPLAEMGWADLQQQLDVQLKGAFLLSQQCASAMARHGGGRIVNITTQAIQGAPTPHWTAYAVAKAALATLSRQLAVELGPSAITVNCVAPGMTETALIGDIPQKQQMIIGRQTPLRRLAQPDDVAAAVAYLVSDEARFVTGHTLDVNGGMVMR